MPSLDTINDLLIKEQDELITELEFYNEIFKAQLANSIPKERVEALLEDSKQLKHQAEQFMNSYMCIRANGKIYVLKELLSNQPINQEGE